MAAYLTEQEKAYRRWLKTDAGMEYQAKNLRYKRAALDMLHYEFIDDRLYGIATECSELEWAILEDDELVDALNHDSDDLQEFRFKFADLFNKCEELRGILSENYITEHFDDLFVGIMGNRYKRVGYDSYQEDYYHLTGFEGELAQSESSKRLMKLTKEKLLRICGQCFGIAVSIIDIQHSFDSLKAAISLLKGDRLQLLKDVKDVEDAYNEMNSSDFSFETVKRFDSAVTNLPDEVWVV